MEILSLWRSPLDRAALSGAVLLAERQPRCTTIGYGEDFSAMTIFNFGHYYTGGPANSALTTMFGQMNPGPYSTVGGRVFFPQQSFPVNAPSNGIPVPDQCDIDGSGGGGTISGATGTPFFHFVVTPEGPGVSILFDCIDTGAGHTSGGIYFRSLAFQWGASTHAADTCIFAGVWNTRAVNCTFTDCPRAFHANDLSCTLEQCTIDYTVATPTNTKAVILDGAQDAVIGPGQFSQTSPASGGASGWTCISIEGAEHPIVSGMYIYEWAVGIDFSQGQDTRRAQITNCDIECWGTALNIQLRTSTSETTAGIKATSCLLAKSDDSTDGGPIVRIDTNGNASESLLNDVTLLDCTVINMSATAPPNQYGLQIVGGSNIKVIGGTYSNNSISAGAGIAITGSPTDVQIIGANLQPSYPASPNVRSQEYGLLVTGNPGAVLVSGCDMTGYTAMGTEAVRVSGTPTELVILDCRGYNDQNTPLSATASMLTAGVSAATSSSPYFGPSVVIYSGSSVTLHVFGQMITSSFGIVFLPSPYDQFSFSPAPPTTFSWVGK